MQDVPEGGDSIEVFLDAMGIVEPESLREPSVPEGGDSIEGFLDATGITPEVEPEPLKEPSVPTTPVLSHHLEVWNPFQAGLIDDEPELRRLFYRELFQRGPYSLTAFLNGDVRSTLLGVYCLFYVGDAWEPYAPVRSEASTLAIYVGESVAASLGGRLQEHARSIHQQGLGLENFTCRFMGLPDWFDGEQMLLRDFSPLWNRYLRGFGHAFGYADIQKVSDWDLFHQSLTGKARLGAASGGGRPVEPIQEMFSVGVRESLMRYRRSEVFGV